MFFGGRPPSGDMYQRRELETRLGLDKQREALRELERERRETATRYHFLLDSVLRFSGELVIGAFIVALVLAVGVGVALLKG
jgi:hypothetical protein